MALYWINNANSFRLAIAARPRGGDWLGDDVLRFQNSGVRVLVSMLTSAETKELGLAQEREECCKCGIEYLNFPIEDLAVPGNILDFKRFVDQIAKQVREGKSVAVHCRAGIGRSSLLACSVLICLGVSSELAWQLIKEARGCIVPDTDEQRRFTERLNHA